MWLCLRKELIKINFIYKQHHPEIKKIKYGDYYSNYNGCGWIAVYNAMQLLGNRITADEIINDLEPTLWFGGKFGTPLSAIEKYFEQWGYTIKKSIGKTNIKKNIARVNILFYPVGWKLHFTTAHLGIHYLKFFNADAKLSKTIMPLEEFLNEKKGLPIIHLAISKEN